MYLFCSHGKPLFKHLFFIVYIKGHENRKRTEEEFGQSPPGCCRTRQQREVNPASAKGRVRASSHAQNGLVWLIPAAAPQKHLANGKGHDIPVEETS
jgi:hypothetical protein